jgi:hypothetical protein
LRGGDVNTFSKQAGAEQRQKRKAARQARQQLIANASGGNGNGGGGGNTNTNTNSGSGGGGGSGGGVGVVGSGNANGGFQFVTLEDVTVGEKVTHSIRLVNTGEVGTVTCAYFIFAFFCLCLTLGSVTLVFVNQSLVSFAFVTKHSLFFLLFFFSSFFVLPAGHRIYRAAAPLDALTLPLTLPFPYHYYIYFYLRLFLTIIFVISLPLSSSLPYHYLRHFLYLFTSWAPYLQCGRACRRAYLTIILLITYHFLTIALPLSSSFTLPAGHRIYRAAALVDARTSGIATTTQN